MHVHPVFTNLFLHTNNELSELLGSAIATRKTIHEWPLSCVQQLVLQNDTKLIYKTQLPPTVEPSFYQCATSQLLPKHKLLGKLGQCETMTMEWIDAPLLSNLATNETSLVEHGKQLIAQIGVIEGNCPVYLNIGTAQTWLTTVQEILEKLQNLISNKRFLLAEPGIVEQLHTWANNAAVVNGITSQPRITHGDLKADQVFVTEYGYRVIDWQRSVIAPPETDLVSLLVEQHIDPRPYAPVYIIQLYWFLRLHWAITAQHDLFPAKRWPLFDQWAKEAFGQLFA
jgi:hypothetical protein